ncbi:hypothetical protein [Thiomicrorhabdus heinhorstiae]|uniref:OmpH family outer membrane protein n=1 Tax=Thiomicrorhabdus heinhorstiae TaxID=2748010 RepID=A0ABS0BU21_9GAMM|nr:hypothetical protein [Thiomicrorhabdus heinhorstiae]MBF6057337.1 hypothetical protein [Thiomicrorhabdus heinhorstiae]
MKKAALLIGAICLASTLAAFADGGLGSGAIDESQGQKINSADVFTFEELKHCLQLQKDVKNDGASILKEKAFLEELTQRIKQKEHLLNESKQELNATSKPPSYMNAEVADYNQKVKSYNQMVHDYQADFKEYQQARQRFQGLLESQNAKTAEFNSQCGKKRYYMQDMIEAKAQVE